MDSVFEPALNTLATSVQQMFGSASCRDYVTEHDLEAGPRTPQCISIDAFDDLAPELREQDIMILRLGSAPDGHAPESASATSTQRWTVYSVSFIDGSAGTSSGKSNQTTRISSPLIVG